MVTQTMTWRILNVFAIVGFPLVSGCASHSWICAGPLMVSHDVEGTTQELSANFRDDRLLFSDVTLIGTARERNVPDGSRPGFVISAAFHSQETCQALEVAVEFGRPGTDTFSRDVIYSTSSTFSGTALVESVEGEGSIREGRLVLNFKRAGGWHRLELPTTLVLKTSMEQSSRQALTMSLGKQITLIGIAEPRKGNAALRGDGFYVWLRDVAFWPNEVVRKKVAVTGRLEEDHGLPVFINDPNEPLMQGIPVPKGSVLGDASHRFVLVDATWRVIE